MQKTAHEAGFSVFMSSNFNDTMKTLNIAYLTNSNFLQNWHGKFNP
jgi:hypothetical protein